MIALPVWLMLSPADYFDYGESVCPSVLLFDRECPGCGMTRATQHLLHFEFSEAMDFNRLSIFLIPVLALLYANIFRKLVMRIIKQGKKSGSL
ncbi:MAG: DUF2752 domain-containing protein [Bacteroidia bacterium]|nr:DUF2752 domain-containing protein [Bacteroidia bacterium]